MENKGSYQYDNVNPDSFYQMDRCEDCGEYSYDISSDGLCPYCQEQANMKAPDLTSVQRLYRVLRKTFPCLPANKVIKIARECAETAERVFGKNPNACYDCETTVRHNDFRYFDGKLLCRPCIDGIYRSHNCIGDACMVCAAYAPIQKGLVF